MDKKLEQRIARLERAFTNKFEDASSDQFISSDDLFYILASLAGLSNANSILKNEASILENVATKYKDENVRLDLPILANNFNGDLSDLLSEIFDHVDGIKQQAERAIKYHTYIRRKYSLQ